MTRREPAAGCRPLTADEYELVRWMMEHGTPEAAQQLPQLELARVAPWRCPCGCASIDFEVDGRPTQTGGMCIIADFVFGTDDEMSGIFVFTKGGILAGLEAYGLAGEAPKSLPSPDSLRPIPMARS